MTDAKICGVRTRSAIDAAVAGGARWIGLVHFPKSPRHLDLDSAALLAEYARGRVVVVVLLVEPDDATVDAVVATVRPDMIQLHGSETPDRIAEIRTRAGLPVIKAVGVATEADVRAALRYLRPKILADVLLFDAKAPPGARMPGGLGIPFDWRILSAVPLDTPYLLAGGLTPDNVRECVMRTGAPAVDVSSGVETAPGEKSPELIRGFLQAVKTAMETL